VKSEKIDENVSRQIGQPLNLNTETPRAPTEQVLERSTLHKDFQASMRTTYTCDKMSSDSDNETAHVAEKRVVKKSTKRGKYRRADNDKRLCIVAAAEKQLNWKGVATVNGVPWSTAYNRIRKPDQDFKQRGGARHLKTTETVGQLMMKLVEENPEKTLETIKDKTFIETGTSVSTSTNQTYLEGRMLTIKKKL